MPHAKNPAPPIVSHAMAERHEALWIRLTALHKDLGALAAKKPADPVGDPLRITAESLLSDCVPFVPGRSLRLPVAAPDHAGLLVQLGQALALLDAFEVQHSFWSADKACRCWRVSFGALPVARLRPNLPPPVTIDEGRDLRDELARQMDQRWNRAFEEGFAAGRATRQGMSDAASPVLDGVAAFRGDATTNPSYPRLRHLG